MIRFKVGDRVRAVDGLVVGASFRGLEGTVVGINNRNTEHVYTVNFDNPPADHGPYRPSTYDQHQGGYWSEKTLEPSIEVTPEEESAAIQSIKSAMRR